MITLRPIATLTIGLALAACASSQPKNGFEVTIGDTSASIELSKDMVVSMLEEGLNTSFECDGEVDPELLQLLMPLDRKRHATTSTGRGADRVAASRRGSRLTFTVGDPASANLKATMPWAVGECLLGRATTLDKALGSAAIKVVLTTNDGVKISATVG